MRFPGIVGGLGHSPPYPARYCLLASGGQPQLDRTHRAAAQRLRQSQGRDTYPFKS